MDLSEILCVRHSVAERSLYASQDERDEGPRTGAAGKQGVAGPVGDRADDAGTVRDPLPGSQEGGAGTRAGGGADASPGHGTSPRRAPWQPPQRHDAQDRADRRWRGAARGAAGSDRDLRATVNRQTRAPLHGL